jgi:fibronectin type 3 domain-containing protein
MEVPAGVTATPLNGQATISWLAVTGASSYNIYWSNTSGVTPANGKIISVAAGTFTPSYTQTGLTNGTTYYYVVTAVNSNGESAPSTQVSCTPAGDAPSSVSATPGNGVVTLAWSAMPGASSYNIYWSTTSGVTPGSGTQIAGIPASVAPSYSQTGLANGTTYYYVVTAVNGSNESSPSVQVSASPAVTPVPAEPIGVFATSGIGSVTIGWTATATPGISYNIYWSTNPGVASGPNTKITGATSPYTQTELTNGTTYYYVVTAVNSHGESAPSTQFSCTAGGAPTYVSATPGNGAVTLAWSAEPDASSYNIYWSTTNGVTPANGKIIGVTAGTFTPSSPSYTQTGLTNGTTYYYVVTAVNGSNEPSSPSIQISAIPAVNPAPAEPIGVFADPGNGTVTIGWTAIPYATSYNIYWSTTSGVTPGSGTKIAGATNPYTQTVTNGTPYYYVVTAVNSNGESTASAEVTATPSN